ncbi:BglG family transcription antiterminator [Bacillus haikouensis]|uniref:BglG family transcription antiterminator n=1 Tax=Bacillus haikouensis TaxID=1510468 RepID=UPI00155769A1|nr:PRD domain-containing protein [Bacillus haikouensis]NQD65713.1 BglG family transcription antiterminator [Bacillus haikouensis]
MYISARERRILEVLLVKEKTTTVHDLASDLEVSPRTVHRDLKGIEDILKEYGLQLNKKSGVGIEIIGEERSKSKLQAFLFNLSHSEYTPDERQTLILSILLDAAEPVKLLSLANDLNVTIATISNDLNKVEERLTPFALTLIRKRGYGVQLQGEESSKRKVMSSLILNNLDEFEFISIIKENIQRKSSTDMRTVTDRLLGLVDKKKLLVIERKIEEMKDKLPYTIADSAYIGLVVHLALAIERIQQGEEINFDKKYLESIEDSWEFKVAADIVRGLEEAFGLSISYGEIGYITMHLMGAKLRNNQEHLLEDTSLQVGIKAQELIQFVGKAVRMDLTRNVDLFQGLVAHLRPALYRMKQNMRIDNPLLRRIEEDYSELFGVIEQGANRTFPGLHIPKEEIGYLVMHFASALLNKEKAPQQKALIVCSSGIGTSKMLSTKLHQELPGLETENASLFDLEAINREEYDLIISTIPLKNFTGEYILVSPFLTQEEIDRIMEKTSSKNTEGRKGNPFSETQESHRSDNMDFISDIRSVRDCSSAIFDLLTGFTVTENIVASSIEQALTRACTELKGRGTIRDAASVMSHLLKREKTGGLGIPNTTMALYHTRSDDILAPSFTIFRLRECITVNGMDGEEMKMDTILLMLSAETVEAETLEVLSHISTLVIRDEESMKRFQEGSQVTLQDYLTKELEEFFLTKYKQ